MRRCILILLQFFPFWIHGLSMTPILRQPPGNCGGEDGLAEALEQRGDAVDTAFKGIDLGQ